VIESDFKGSEHVSSEIQPVSEMLCPIFVYLNIGNDHNTTGYVGIPSWRVRTFTPCTILR